jgi:hypothetical protein
VEGTRRNAKERAVGEKGREIEEICVGDMNRSRKVFEEGELAGEGRVGVGM